MKNYFSECVTLEEGKAKFRSLVKEFHPDVFGVKGEKITVEILKQYEKFVASAYRKTASEFFDNSEYTEPEDLTPFTDILYKVMEFNCRVEIVGYWIYCFDSFEVKDLLAGLGFWFSGKHKAWVFSGSKKKGRAGKETLEEIKARKGSAHMKNRNKTEEQKKLA